ncbi:hypothetical protein NDU88_000171 [Pleurodeles waltl]|uniref:Uncharacterized protein n=1 Tax=Pleurodeles waltl TaxID=8319 RepID=A0AAV7VTW1_PLEWA|nr:hypothetical protein NDU88_000171 [Pleurodeles waltl]
MTRLDTRPNRRRHRRHLDVTFPSQGIEFPGHLDRTAWATRPVFLSAAGRSIAELRQASLRTSGLRPEELALPAASPAERGSWDRLAPATCLAAYIRGKEELCHAAGYRHGKRLARRRPRRARIRLSDVTERIKVNARTLSGAGGSRLRSAECHGRPQKSPGT